METPEQKIILVVDDDPEIRMLIEDILSLRHYKVITAFNGLDAIQKSIEAKIDVILLDVCMPIFSGYWFCDAFKKRPQTQNVPVIVISGLGEEYDIKKAYQVGASAYLTKPFSSEQLVEVIEKQFAA